MTGTPPSIGDLDRYVLYQEAVQDPEVEIGFIDRVYRKVRRCPPRSMHEDFSGTAALSCAWVRSHPKRTAVAVDIDADPLRWGQAHNVALLDGDQRRRIRLEQGDACEHDTGSADVVVALNFSYYALHTRERLITWLARARSQLEPDGLLVMDVLGGPSCYAVGEDPKEDREGFVYQWETLAFDPISHRARCAIHFLLNDGREMRQAFTYEWRLWTMPELRDALREAGFDRSTVWWEGVDAETGEGDGRYTAQESAEPLDCWVSYLVASP